MTVIKMQIRPELPVTTAMKLNALHDKFNALHCLTKPSTQLLGRDLSPMIRLSGGSRELQEPLSVS